KYAWNQGKPRWGFLLTSALLSAVSMRYASFYRYFVIWAVPWLVAQMDPHFRATRQKLIQVGLLALVATSSFGIRPAFGVNERIFPGQAVQFLKDNGLRVPFFHEYEFGGYFLWTLEGHPPVLIDGRYPAVQGYQTLYPEILNAIHEKP